MLTPSRTAALLLVSFMTASCTPAFKRAPYAQLFQHTPPPLLHSKPVKRRYAEWVDKGYQGAVRPLSEVFSPATYARKLFGSPPALDVNAFNQVPDSVWFTNRLGKRAMTIAEIAYGPNTIDGPNGMLEVLRGKTSGATPGLMVRDDTGERWIVKFDPPAFPDMASGSELIATKFLHAFGYNVPENYLVMTHIQRFRLARGATTRDSYGQRIPLTKNRLRQILSNLNPTPDGRLRALFSRFIPGTGIGPFQYSGRRGDDPNDIIPHERRRSLRGLWFSRPGSTTRTHAKATPTTPLLHPRDRTTDMSNTT